MFLLNLMPFCMQRITRRLGGGSAGVYENTLRKPTTLPTKLAEACERASHAPPEFQRLRYRHLIHILQIATHGDARGNARNPDVRILEHPGN